MITFKSTAPHTQGHAPFSCGVADFDFKITRSHFCIRRHACAREISFRRGAGRGEETNPGSPTRSSPRENACSCDLALQLLEPTGESPDTRWCDLGQNRALAGGKITQVAVGGAA